MPFALGDLRQPPERICGASGLPLRTAASTSSASSHSRGAEAVRILGGPLGGGQGVLVAAEAVVEHRRAPVGGGQPEALAAAQHVLPAGVDQRQRLGLVAAQDRQRDGAPQAEVAAGRLEHGGRLGGVRPGRRELARRRGRYGPARRGRRGAARARRRGARAATWRVTSSSQASSSPRARGDVAGQPEPAQLVLLGDRLLPERAQRVLERAARPPRSPR